MAAVTVIAKDGDTFIETISQKTYKAHNIFQVLGAFIAQDEVFSKAAGESWKIVDGKDQAFRTWRCSYHRETASAPACPRCIVFVKEA